MVEALQNVVDLLKQIREDMPLLIAEVLEENKEAIAALNVAQLKEGKRSDGSFLPDYSPGSVARFGKRPGPMTLEKTGRFHKGIIAKINPSFIEIIGTDSKTGKLEALYDITITGIPDDKIEEVSFNILLPGLRDKIRVKYFAK